MELLNQKETAINKVKADILILEAECVVLGADMSRRLELMKKFGFYPTDDVSRKLQKTKERIDYLKRVLKVLEENKNGTLESKRNSIS